MRPLGPPDSVITVLLLAGKERDPAGPGNDELLVPTSIVIRLPFGSVVTMPVPQTEDSWGEAPRVLQLHTTLELLDMLGAPDMIRELGTFRGLDVLGGLVFSGGCWTITVTVTVVLELAVIVLAGPLTVIVLLTPVVTVLAGPLRPGVKFGTIPGVLVEAGGGASATAAGAELGGHQVEEFDTGAGGTFDASGAALDGTGAAAGTTGPSSIEIADGAGGGGALEGVTATAGAGAGAIGAMDAADSTVLVAIAATVDWF